MDLLARILGGGDLQAGTPGPADDFWYGPVGGLLTDAGIRVDAEGAQKLSAWYRGRDLLATILAMLPLPVYERLPNDGGAIVAREHPLYDVLHDKPNDYQDAFQWRRQKMYHLVDHGNGYDWIVAGPRGFVDQLRPIHPTLVTPEQIATGPYQGRILYHVRDPKTGRSTPHTQDEIFHLRGASEDGVVGKGILAYARSSLGIALATESYASRIYSKGTLNGGVIETPAAMDPEAAKAMARTFVTKVGDWHEAKVLEQGAVWKPNKMTPEDAQMLLSRKHGIDDIARWLGMTRMMLENSDPSFGNAEQFNQNLITYSMGGWLSLVEFAVNDQLIENTRRFFAQFTRDAIVRGDIAVRAAANVAYVNAGIRSVDEVRGQENWNKRGGKADELREPQNITGKPAAADPAPNDPAPPQKKPAPASTRRPKPADDTGDPAAARARTIVTASAARVLRKEILAAQRAAVTHAADPVAWATWVDSFYADHHQLVMQTMCVDEPTARGYVALQRSELLEGLSVTEAWTPTYLAGLALDK